jgi:hypothetical protein
VNPRIALLLSYRQREAELEEPGDKTSGYRV